MTPKNVLPVVVVGSYGVGLWIRAPRVPVAGETVLGSGFALGHGGKGSNQAVGAARLGTPTKLLVCVGEDSFGSQALALWKKEGVEAHVLVRPGMPTMAGFILLDEQGENRIITDPGANASLTPADAETFIAQLPDESGVLLTQLEIPIPAVVAALQAARACGYRTILNPAPAQRLARELFRSIDIITPNQSEAKILLDLPPDDETGDFELATALKETGVGAVVLTRGAAGALIVDEFGSAMVPAPAVPVIDTTGAGDGFNAALASALARGLTLREATVEATHAGAFVVTRAGVVTALPMRSDLGQMLTHGGVST